MLGAMPVAARALLRLWAGHIPCSKLSSDMLWSRMGPSLLLLAYHSYDDRVGGTGDVLGVLAPPVHCIRAERAKRGARSHRCVRQILYIDF